MFIEDYEYGITGNYLLIEDSIMENVGYEFKMICENEIPALLKCTYRNNDGKSQYAYDISSKIDIYTFFEHEKIKFNNLINIINGLILAFDSISEFLLYEKHLLLDPRHIFIDIDSKRLYLCYYPHAEKDFKEEFKGFAEYIIQNTDHTDADATRLAYDFYMKIIKEDYMLRKLIISNVPMTNEVNSSNEITEEENYNENFYHIEDEIPPKLVLQEKVILLGAIFSIFLILILIITGMINKTFFISTLFMLNEMKVFMAILLSMSVFLLVGVLVKYLKRKRKFEKEQNMKFTEDSYNAGIAMETDCVGDTQKLGDYDSTPRLIRNNGKDVIEIKINKTPFVIGKKHELCDCIIEGQSVSRMHARIVREKGEYWLYDLNSTNGTYLNNSRIKHNEGVILRENDEISFAGELFYFK